MPIRGDLADPDCPSVTLLRLRADTRLPPHSAPVDRGYLILSGTVHVGVGKKWDDSRMRTLPAGSFWLIPADTSTFEWAEDEVVCQVTTFRHQRDCPRPDEPSFTTPDRIGWTRSGTVERAILAGSPDQAGCPWVVRTRIPAGVTSAGEVEPPAGEVLWTVLSGSLHRGGGSPGKPSSSAEIPAGSVLSVPRGEDADFSGVVDTIAQREFTGTGPRICRLRESLR